MIRIAPMCLAVALAAADAARAQSALLGSLPATGPAVSDSAHRLYSPLLGDWDVTVTDHLPDGTRHTGTGEWHFAWVLEGRAIQDVWISPRRGERQSAALSPFDRYGTTVRYFDPTIGAWRLTWVNPARNYVATLVGRTQGNDIVQEGSGDEGAKLRWTFFDITPKSFSWRGELSTDSGRTWRTVQEMWGRRSVRSATTTGPAANVMDALLARGPAEENANALGLFGQFAGSWSTSLRVPNADGSATTGEGEIHMGWVLEGRALQDVWIFPKRGTAPGEPRGEYGTTIRFFDRAAGNWRSIWITPLNHATRMFRVRPDGDEIFLETRTATGDAQRWIFSAITPTSFHWRNVTTPDDGRSWKLREEVWARKADAR